MKVTAIELEEFFQELGQFTYYAQHAEHIVRQILMIQEVRARGVWPVEPEEGAEIAAIFEQKTLGALIGRLEGITGFPPSLLASLRRLNGERKQIIHHLARSIGEFSRDSHLRKTVVSRLITAHELASEVSGELVWFVVEFTKLDAPSSRRA